MELVSINDGEGTAGAYYPKGTCDFISKDCLQTARSMNTVANSIGGWTAMPLRATLNTTIYDLLPQTIKDAIVDKTHKTSSGSGSSILIEHSDKLWLPTEWEISETTHVDSENANVNKHYALFDSTGDRIKHLGTIGSATAWWTETLSSSNWVYVSYQGIVNPSTPNNSYGVPLCFRIGQLFT